MVIRNCSDLLDQFMHLLQISNFEEKKEVAGPAPAGASSSAKKRRPFFVKSLSKTDMRYLVTGSIVVLSISVGFLH